MKLKKSNFTFLCILQTIYELFDYYAILFQLIIETSAIYMDASLHELDGMTIINVNIPITEYEINYSESEMKDILNDYLSLCLLPSRKYLQPYAIGNSQYEIMESLYLDSITRKVNSYQFRFIYIDNPQAFQYVSNKLRYIQI